MKYDLADARLAAAGHSMMPYLARAFMNFHILETPELGDVDHCGGMATDCYYRLYYDPKILDKWTLKETAAVILHETMHCIYRHADRAKAKIGTNPSQGEHMLWNMAADCVINSNLRDAKIELPDADKICFPEKFNMPPNLTAEEYYDLLYKQAPKAPMQCMGGSSADGQQRGWEHGDPGDKPKTKDGKSAGGIGEDKQDMIRRAVAKDMKEHVKKHGRGSLPAGMERWAKEILEPSENPAERLLAECRYALDSQHGFWSTTYDRPSRRSLKGGPMLPRYRQPVPRVTLIVDTSGSMCEKDLGLALGVVGQVLKALPNQSGVTVLTGDTQVETCQRVFRPEQVSLVGGGGTSMDSLIVDAANRKPKSDVIFVLTDGYTPWPSEPVEAKVLACLSRPNTESEVPSWIRTVVLHPAEKELAEV